MGKLASTGTSSYAGEEKAKKTTAQTDPHRQSESRATKQTSSKDLEQTVERASVMKSKPGSGGRPASASSMRRSGGLKRSNSQKESPSSPAASASSSSPKRPGPEHKKSLCFKDDSSKKLDATRASTATVRS